VHDLIERELVLIRELRFEHYFLTVEDIVRYARMRGILCQGRGSAANSAVCYVLGVTEVDPARMDLLLERFISKERHEPPDIDIDFEHQRREEVMQYIYNKYRRHRAALAATVITYRRRMAIRDVARELGFPTDLTDAPSVTRRPPLRQAFSTVDPWASMHPHSWSMMHVGTACSSAPSTFSTATGIAPSRRMIKAQGRFASV
jgi:DNA polymerase III alpha subunit